MSRITITRFANTLMHDEAALVERMRADAILQACGRPYQEHINRGHFIVANLRQRECNALLTEKGQIWLARKYPVGCKLGAQQ
jgi:hypothetical protein